MSVGKSMSIFKVATLTIALAMVLGLVAMASGLEAQPQPSRPHATIFEPAEIPDLEKIPPPGIFRNFRLLDHNDFGQAGADNNGNSIGFKDDCIYVAQRGDERGVIILDSELTVQGELPPVPGANSQELQTVADVNLLVVQGFGSGSAGVNFIQVWDVTDCETPVLRSVFDYGAGRPHEFFTWRDPFEPSRVLIYQGMSGGPEEAEHPNLRVIDVSNKDEPQLLATFDLRDFGVPRTEPPSEANGFIAQQNGLHSLSVSDDGRRVYLAQNDAGFLILDSTPLASSASAPGCDESHLGPDPCLRMVNPDPAGRLDFSPPGPGRTHSAVKVPEKETVVLTHEILGSASCPWGWVRIADTRFEALPKQISTFLLKENIAENCPRVGEMAIATGSDYTSHNPTVLQNLLLISWRGAGTRAIDISNPFMPHEVGFYFPQTAVGADGQRVRIHMASYPVIKDGLVYVLDRFNGLFVLRYTGPFREEVNPLAGPCTGNASPNQDIGMLKGRCSP